MHRFVSSGPELWDCASFQSLWKLSHVCQIRMERLCEPAGTQPFPKSCLQHSGGDFIIVDNVMLGLGRSMYSSHAIRIRRIRYPLVCHLLLLIPTLGLEVIVNQFNLSVILRKICVFFCESNCNGNKATD